MALTKHGQEYRGWSADQRGLLDNMRVSAIQLLETTADILTYSRLEANTSRFPQNVFDVASLVDSVVCACRTRAAAQKVRVRCEVPDVVRARLRLVLGQEQNLSHCLTHLLLHPLCQPPSNLTS